MPYPDSSPCVSDLFKNVFLPSQFCPISNKPNQGTIAQVRIMLILPDSFGLDSVRLNQPGPGPDRKAPGKMMVSILWISSQCTMKANDCLVVFPFTIQLKRRSIIRKKQGIPFRLIHYIIVRFVYFERPQCCWDRYPTPGN